MWRAALHYQFQNHPVEQLVLLSLTCNSVSATAESLNVGRLLCYRGQHHWTETTQLTVPNLDIHRKVIMMISTGLSSQDMMSSLYRSYAENLSLPLTHSSHSTGPWKDSFIYFLYYYWPDVMIMK